MSSKLRSGTASLPPAERAIGKMLILSQFLPSNYQIYSFEIRQLIKSISSEFGQDIHNLGEPQDSEFIDGMWVGREWHFNEMQFNLTMYDHQIQLFIIYSTLSNPTV